MRILGILLLTTISIGLGAQDKEARKILDKVAKSYESATTISVDFDLTIKYPDDEPMTYPSSVKQSGKKFLFKNSEQEYYGNGDDIWVYIPAHNEVQINDFEEDELEDYFITPLDLLTQYKNGNYAYQIADDHGSTVDIELKPNDEYSDYSKLRVTIVKKSNEIKVVKVFGKDASTFTLAIQSVVRNMEMPDSLFVFDKSLHPGVHIEDLRLD